MRLFLSALITFGFLSAVGAQTPSAVEQSEDKSVRVLVQRYVAARETADPVQLAALFTADADQLVSSGEWRRGQADVVAGTVASSKKEAGGRRAVTIETVRFLGPDVALADGRYDLTSANGVTRHMWTAILCRRESSGWKIAAIRNMLPAKP
jgi:uncharacterized protein (TIGR02246 family)